jgi:hypothetical protein
MTTRDRLFLIAFDRKTGASTVEDLGHELGAAMEVYAAREQEVADQPDLEVVLVGSPSLSALKSTHSSYFGASERLRNLLTRAG